MLFFVNYTETAYVLVILGVNLVASVVGVSYDTVIFVIVSVRRRVFLSLLLRESYVTDASRLPREAKRDHLITEYPKFRKRWMCHLGGILAKASQLTFLSLCL